MEAPALHEGFLWCTSFKGHIWLQSHRRSLPPLKESSKYHFAWMYCAALGCVCDGVLGFLSPGLEFPPHRLYRNHLSNHGQSDVFHILSKLCCCIPLQIQPLEHLRMDSWRYSFPSVTLYFPGISFFQPPYEYYNAQQ